MALSYVRCHLLRSTFAATAPRSAVAELGVVRCHIARLTNNQNQKHRKETVMEAMLLIWIVCAILAGAIGAMKNRAPLGVILGILLGFIGVLIICFVPKAEKETT